MIRRSDDLLASKKYERAGKCLNVPCDGKNRYSNMALIRVGKNKFFPPWKFCSKECHKEFIDKRTEGAKERVKAFLEKQKLNQGG